ncbi:hypothetical protein TNCV_658231 [Trichonephila clavipes]|uniref:Uncharacterized protein n=1 Tax=Trichonephila clavipes TaxID=2585209 RepID=A0A8X6STE8_TRICX|nr:hypothetical protein TNCV_658231 [Trichonephila clavipes]
MNGLSGCSFFLIGTSRVDSVSHERGLHTKPSGRVVAYCASIPWARGSNPFLGKVDSAFQPFSRSINEYQASAWELNTGVSRQTDHLTGTSDHAPQCSRPPQSPPVGVARQLGERAAQVSSSSLDYSSGCSKVVIFELFQVMEPLELEGAFVEPL